MLTRLSLFVLATALAGCSPAVTEIAVVVDTDLAIPDEVQEITLRVDSVDGLNATARATLDPENPELPIHIRVTTSDNDRNAPIVLTATALRHVTEDLDDIQVTASIHTHFVDGKALLLRVLLTRACLDTVCDAGETCEEGVCVNGTVDPEGLPLFTGTLPPPLVDRNGTPGLDAGPDAGDADAGSIF